MAGHQRSPHTTPCGRTSRAVNRVVHTGRTPPAATGTTWDFRETVLDTRPRPEIKARSESLPFSRCVRVADHVFFCVTSDRCSCRVFKRARCTYYVVVAYLTMTIVNDCDFIYDQTLFISIILLSLNYRRLLDMYGNPLKFQGGG